MKVSLNWLREFVDFGKLDAETIGNSITIHTAELEEVISLKNYFENVVTGKLLSHKHHPSSEKLSVAQFDCGALGKKQIVFGQVHEVREGEILPIAIDGAKLKSGLEIKNTEIRGTRSEGMIADNRELGMKNEGLLRLPASTKLGICLPKFCEEFGDSLFDIDNKSLTHRPDLWGHEGIARELAAIFGKKLLLKNPKVKLPSKGTSVRVKIETNTCRRFCGLRISRVHVHPSAITTQIRLENLDIRAISNLVDVTNLVLLELGQPMHIFDAKHVKGSIIVRQARQGESLVALDGVKYQLTPADTVVADEEKVLSIAGIMGGEFSGVTENTTEVILECANWDPVAIRRTSTRLGLRSDSSIRYEKSLDPALCERALLHAVEYILSSCPQAEIIGPLTDEYPIKSKPITIDLNPQYVRMHSGIPVTNQEIQNKLQSVGFGVKPNKNLFRVEVPSWRATKDISIPEDLIEEVVRLYGFENILPVLPTLPINPPRSNALRRFEWRIRDFFAARGFMEVYNYSFVNEKDAQFTGNTNYVCVQNPLSSEHEKLRQTLISNMIGNIESELRTHKKLQLLEIGKIYRPLTNEILPQETLHFNLLLGEIDGCENNLFFELKSHLLAFLTSWYANAEFRVPQDIPQYCHPAKCAEIIISDEPIGIIATLHPQNLPVKNANIVFVEINVEALLSLSQKSEIQYQKLSPFPTVSRDISIVLDEKVFMQDVEKFMYEASALLKSVELFDEFQDDRKIGKTLKNLAFHLKFQSQEKTLDEQTIEKNFQAIVDILQRKCGAKLRVLFDTEH